MPPLLRSALMRICEEMIRSHAAHIEAWYKLRDAAKDGDASRFRAHAQDYGATIGLVVPGEVSQRIDDADERGAN